MWSAVLYTTQGLLALILGGAALAIALPIVGMTAHMVRDTIAAIRNR
jgi:hypothetical protein